LGNCPIKANEQASSKRLIRRGSKIFFRSRKLFFIAGCSFRFNASLEKFTAFGFFGDVKAKSYSDRNICIIIRDSMTMEMGNKTRMKMTELTPTLQMATYS
jgi:hypothetical protein